MARRVLPAASILIVIIGWARLVGERHGLYGTSFGLAIFASANIATFAILLGSAARSLNTSFERLDVASHDLAITNERAKLANFRLAAIIDSSDDAIISNSLDGIITSWNAAAERIFGYSSAEAVGLPLVMLFPPDRVSEEVDKLRRVASGESVHHFESVRIRKDRKPILVTATISPLRDATAVIIGVTEAAGSSKPSRNRKPASRPSSALPWTGSLPSMNSSSSPCSTPPQKPCLAALLPKFWAPAWSASSRHVSVPNMKGTFANSVIPRLPAAAWGAWVRFSVCGPTEKSFPSKPPSRRPKSTARNFSP
jgi:PAS domain S-box-containing protein